MPKRAHCGKCHYPVKTCICDLLENADTVTYSGNIHIIQHPKEALHSKNSVRLLSLLVPELTIWPGESHEDFKTLELLTRQANLQWGCVFPSEQSSNIEDLPAPISDVNLIFIDATWRKARKIWYLNPWLHNLPCWHLPESVQQQYHIRKSPQENHLSTLEAVALSIQKDCDSTPLLDVFAKFQQRFYQFAKRTL